MKRSSPKKAFNASRAIVLCVAVVLVLVEALILFEMWMGPRKAPVAVPSGPQWSQQAIQPEALPPEELSAATTSSTVIQMDMNDVTLATSSFATYVEEPVKVTPRASSVAYAADLSSVVRANDIGLPLAAKPLLIKNGFVVVPSKGSEFYPAYENFRYSQIPFFVTTDSILHTYHLMFDAILKRTEQKTLAPSLVRLSDQMLKVSLAQYDAVKGTEWEAAARQNVGFFSVAMKLNNASFEVPAMVKDDVAKELAMIDAHAERQNSVVIPGLAEDYTQYVPRGHYTTSEDLKTYFKMMMWYGRVGFTIGQKYPETVRSATLMTIALRDPQIRARWQQISDPINFMVGQSDDVTWQQFGKLVDAAYGPSSDARAVSQDMPGYTKLFGSFGSLPEPKINSGHINADTGDRQTEFRFMGQRFTMDANTFQQLIDTDLPRRSLPRALDICAAYGSSEAYDLVMASEPEYAKDYASQMSKVRKEVSSQTLTDRTKTLYGTWLYTLQPLAAPAPTGYPSFMRNQAWTRKQLMSYLGSYTELKHDTVLYAKQAYAAEMGGGEPEYPILDDRGYVEPQPQLYARLASLADMTNAGLASRGLLDDATKQDLQLMGELARRLKGISVKELENTKLTDEEYDFIRSYGGNIEHLLLRSLDQARGEATLDTPSALVTDVATNPLGGTVLEEGTGYVADIYVIVMIDGKPHLTTGAVFTQYEFTQDWSNRLTDEEWRKMLSEGTNVPLADWTHAFISP